MIVFEAVDTVMIMMLVVIVMMVIMVVVMVMIVTVVLLQEPRFDIENAVEIERVAPKHLR